MFQSPIVLVIPHMSTFMIKTLTSLTMKIHQITATGDLRQKNEKIFLFVNSIYNNSEVLCDFKVRRKSLLIRRRFVLLKEKKAIVLFPLFINRL